MHLALIRIPAVILYLHQLIVRDLQVHSQVEPVHNLTKLIEEVFQGNCS